MKKRSRSKDNERNQRADPHKLHCLKNIGGFARKVKTIDGNLGSIGERVSAVPIVLAVLPHLLIT
jgi:hypothetical protein